MTSQSVAPASVPAETLEQRLLLTLRNAKTALDGAQLREAAELMQTANGLCEAALREPVTLSRSGLAEIQRLLAVCVVAGRPLQDELLKRMADSAAPGKAAKAYRPRSGTPGR